MSKLFATFRKKNSCKKKGYYLFYMSSFNNNCSARIRNIIIMGCCCCCCRYQKLCIQSNRNIVGPNFTVLQNLLFLAWKKKGYSFYRNWKLCIDSNRNGKILYSFAECSYEEKELEEEEKGIKDSGSWAE